MDRSKWVSEGKTEVCDGSDPFSEDVFLPSRSAQSRLLMDSGTRPLKALTGRIVRYSQREAIARVNDLMGGEPRESATGLRSI